MTRFICAARKKFNVKDFRALAPQDLEGKIAAP
jgi:hypothetical protein